MVELYVTCALVKQCEAALHHTLAKGETVRPGQAAGVVCVPAVIFPKSLIHYVVVQHPLTTGLTDAG